MFRIARGAAMLLAGWITTPALGASALQCVPYARIVSGVNIRGDALTWWDQAASRYQRGHAPRRGAVLTFRPMGPMTLGHVAVVSKVLDDRRLLIRHANWSVPGAIEEDVPVIDVSEEGDWSQVRVWHSPTQTMGARTNPTFGFIYSATSRLRPFEPDPALGTSVRLATADADMLDKTADAAPQQAATMQRAAKPAPTPRLNLDMRAMRFADATPSARSLADIIADVKRDARMR